MSEIFNSIFLTIWIYAWIANKHVEEKAHSEEEEVKLNSIRGEPGGENALKILLITFPSPLISAPLLVFDLANFNQQ